MPAVLFHDIVPTIIIQSTELIGFYNILFIKILKIREHPILRTDHYNSSMVIRESLGTHRSCGPLKHCSSVAHPHSLPTPSPVLQEVRSVPIFHQ